MFRVWVLGIVIAGVTLLAMSPTTAAYNDGECWDSGDGRGCQWAGDNGWYGCYLFAGAYNDHLIGGAAICQDGAEIDIEHW